LEKFDIPLDALVSPFVRKVMSIVSEIPYGEVVSYQHVAKKVGSPKGARAVGRAVGANPLPIIVPCHRVITSAKTLGGYSAGLDIKAFLLSLELRKKV
jgi:methylated-DNA-[protein]-cysteine S-methyltransferase